MINQIMDIEMLPDTDLTTQEAEALHTWVQATAAVVAARAWHDAAVRSNRGTRATDRNLQTALAAERTARDRHRALSDELARRRIAPLRPQRAA
jgi:hypothetical protein